jgi:hypothetical protein
MKNPSAFLLTLVLLPAAAAAQALPDDPAPSTPPSAQSASSSRQAIPLADGVWIRVQKIANGEEVLVTNTYGPPLRCRFAGATDDYLFCDPPGSPAGAGYRFERDSVLDVKVVRPPRNWHPGLLSAMIGGGLIVGIAASSNTDAGHATEAGLIGALIAGGIAAPLVFLQPQQFNSGPGVSVSLRPHRLSRHPGLPFRPRAGLPVH